MCLALFNLYLAIQCQPDTQTTNRTKSPSITFLDVKSPLIKKHSLLELLEYGTVLLMNLTLIRPF